MGGRPRKPVEIKEAQGTANQTTERRLKEVRIPMPPEITQADADALNIPAAPDHLGPLGRGLWMRAAVQLKSVGLFFPTVYEYLESYCRCYETKEEAWAYMKQHGKYVMEGESETKAGVKRVCQEYKVYNDMIDKMVLLGAKLALTPADKSRVSAIIADTTADKNSQKKITVGG